MKAITKETEGEFKKLLLLSGEQFIGSYDNGQVMLVVYSSVDQRQVQIPMSQEEAIQLHDQVRTQYLEAVKSTFPQATELQGLESISLT